MSARRITVVGSLNLDLVASVPSIPLPGQTLSASGLARHAGGKGANQAAAAALAGGNVAMIGCHGSDGFETLLLETLRAKGVDLAGVQQVEGPTGMAFILVSADGQNSIVVISGANGALSAEIVRAHREQLAGCAMILTQLETPIASLGATLEIAGEAGVPVMLDPAPARPLDGAVLRQVTWLTPNESEAASLMGAAVPRDAAGRRGFAEKLLGLGPRNLLLKLGGDGVYIATNTGLREHLPAYRVSAVDTTAAGDAFNGAMAVALTEGADVVEAARFAGAAAALAVTRPGAMDSLATRAEIDGFRKSA